MSKEKSMPAKSPPPHPIRKSGGISPSPRAQGAPAPPKRPNDSATSARPGTNQGDPSVDRIAAVFAVPPMVLGPEPRLNTPRQRGVYLRAQCQYMGLGIDDWPDEAQQVEFEDRYHLMGLDQPHAWSSDIRGPLKRFLDWITTRA